MSAKTTIGGFGSRNTKRGRPMSASTLRRSTSKSRVGAPVQDFETTLSSNEKGQVLVAGVPMGVYEI